jgi:hypothetical protein
MLDKDRDLKDSVAGKERTPVMNLKWLGAKTN